MRKVITMVLHNRPRYTRVVLTALARCDGIEDYLVLPRVEPGNEQVIEMAHAIDFAEVRVTVNRERLGCGRNTYGAWQAGFKAADFIVHIEDDTVPARDCLRFMEHCRKRYRHNHQIFSVAAYNRFPCPPEHIYSISTRSAYTCWIVGIWKNRWSWASKQWSPNPNVYATHLANRVLDHDLREVYPLLSRSQNIGVEQGIHRNDAEFHRKHHHTDHWAGDDIPTSNDYREVSNPLVTAVMIVSNADRKRGVAAIRSFQKQSYSHKELLIANRGGQPLIGPSDPRIGEIIVASTASTAEIRKVVAHYARGEIITDWLPGRKYEPRHIERVANGQRTNL